MENAGSRRRVTRWAVWLSLGIVFGLVLGFAVGLAKPRAQTPRIWET
jgi:hypothetical protein